MLLGPMQVGACRVPDRGIAHGDELTRRATRRTRCRLRSSEPYWGSRCDSLTVITSSRDRYGGCVRRNKALRVRRLECLRPSGWSAYDICTPPCPQDTIEKTVIRARGRADYGLNGE